MSTLELSVLCVINRATAGIVPFTLTHSAALHQMNCMSLFWNIHKCAMVEAASAESDDKPRWEVMTCYICLLASAVQPSADSMLPREELIMLKGSKGCYQFHICMLCFSRLVYEVVCTNRGQNFHPHFHSVKKILPPLSLSLAETEVNTHFCDWLTLLLMPYFAALCVLILEMPSALTQ